MILSHSAHSFLMVAFLAFPNSIWFMNDFNEEIEHQNVEVLLEPMELFSSIVIEEIEKLHT
jgi:hypothetical protein